MALHVSKKDPGVLFDRRFSQCLIKLFEISPILVSYPQSPNKQIRENIIQLVLYFTNQQKKIQ